jgi:hypothetical protein
MKNKILSNINMPPSKRITLRQIYKDFGLRYDVREARKLMDLPINTPKQEVNSLLKNFWRTIEDDTNPFVYVYTLSGTSRTYYEKKEGNKKVKRLTQPETISITFQSRQKLNVPLRRFAINTISGMQVQSQYPIVSYDQALINLPNEQTLDKFLEQGSGSEKLTTFLTLNRQRIRKTDADIRTTLMYKCIVNLPFKEFNGFRDTGNAMCVPETILHHLKINGRNKKLKLNDVIETLENYSNDTNDIDIKYNVEYKFSEDELEGDYECPNEYAELGQRGYTPEELIQTLESYNCRARMLDVNQKEFITTNNFEGKKYDKHLKTFVGICYGNHLYYCDDEHFVKQLSAKMNYEKSEGFFEFDAYEKKKDFEDKRKYEIIETNDLTELYLEMFEKDNTLKRVRLQDGKIVSMLQGDTVICANPEKTIMEKILGDNFQNENTTILGNIELKKFLNENYGEDLPLSNFNKEVFDAIEKHGNIVKTYNAPNCKVQALYDIIKCRTDCLMNNRLGDYEVFNVSCDIKPYSGKFNQSGSKGNVPLQQGIYYIETEDTDLFMRGNTWYSSDYLKYAKKQKIQFNIKYELIASSVIPANYFKSFVEYIIKKYPDPEHYKPIINKMIGGIGKTHTKKKSGYIEPDFDLAVAYFWDNNEEKIGFTGDVDVDKNIWKNLKGKNCNIDVMYLQDGTERYKVETTEYKTLYQNSMPIYNKVLENEYIRLYELKKRVGGTLIQIKTDAIVVEGNYNRIKCGDKIGEIRYEKCFVDKVYFKDEKLEESYVLDTDISWNIVEEQRLERTADATGVLSPLYSVDLRGLAGNGMTSSFLCTGLAGFGKTHFVKNLPEYDMDTTIRLGFTNVSTENLADEDHPCKTLNSYFGIDFTNGKCSEKKMKRLRNVKCIIITEAFMMPSYIMAYLDKIKIGFPDIKWILEGDPEQLRPVKEEHINWLNCKMFNKLCDGNLIKLKYNKRNNETDNYYKIFNNQNLDEARYVFRKPQRVNICRTNDVRVKINDMCMDKNNYCKFIEKGDGDKEQDLYLNFDTPVMCIKNNKKLNIKNGSMDFKLTGFDENKVLVNDIEFTDLEFMKHFVVAYAFTNHKVQGITIKEPYNIYEWWKMDSRARYTAYSRTSNADNVRII